MNVTSVKNLNGESFSAVQDAALTDFVSSNSASWTGGGGAGVSGTNVVFEPQYEGANYGSYYSATISGDVVVTTGSYFGDDIYPGTTYYSLSSVGASIGNKLDKDKIEASNTIKIINNHAEVTDKAYRQTGFIDIAAHSVGAHGSTVNVDFVSYDANNDSYLYSAIVTLETTASGSYIPNGWSLVSYENNSAIFTKYYSLNERTDTFYLATYYGEWGDFTNAEGSATVYSALEIAPIAFKDEIPSTANFYTNDNPSGFITGVPAGTMNESAFAYDASNNITAYNGSAFKAGDEFPQSATEAIETVTSSSAIWNETTDTVSSNSGAWGGSALPISAGPGIKFEMVDNTLVASIQGPILDEITTAGTWNGREVKQMLQSGTFETNVNSDVIPVNSAYSAASSKWIDPSNSYIQYGSTANILPSTWVLGATGRLGSLSLLNGIVRARSNDTTNTQCTAFVTIKWCEN